MRDVQLFTLGAGVKGFSSKGRTAARRVRVLGHSPARLRTRMDSSLPFTGPSPGLAESKHVAKKLKLQYSENEHYNQTFILRVILSLQDYRDNWPPGQTQPQAGSRPSKVLWGKGQNPYGVGGRAQPSGKRRRRASFARGGPRVLTWASAPRSSLPPSRLLPGASAGGWILKVAVSAHPGCVEGLLQGLGVPGSR